MAKATVSRVTRNPNNKQGCIVTLSNGETLWLQTSYITSVLEGSFIDDARPTALVGSEVEYKTTNVKAGDLVLDKNGEVAKGTTTKYTKERPVHHSIRFGEVVGHVTDYDKAKMQADAFAKASVRAASIFTAAKAKANVAEDDEEEEEEEELPAPKAKSQKVK